MYGVSYSLALENHESGGDYMTGTQVTIIYT